MPPSVRYLVIASFKTMHLPFRVVDLVSAAEQIKSLNRRPQLVNLGLGCSYDGPHLAPDDWADVSLVYEGMCRDSTVLCSAPGCRYLAQLNYGISLKISASSTPLIACTIILSYLPRLSYATSICLNNTCPPSLNVVFHLLFGRRSEEHTDRIMKGPKYRLTVLVYPSLRIDPYTSLL